MEKLICKTTGEICPNKQLVHGIQIELPEVCSIDVGSNFEGWEIFFKASEICDDFATNNPLVCVESSNNCGYPTELLDKQLNEFAAREVPVAIESSSTETGKIKVPLLHLLFNR